MSRYRLILAVSLAVLALLETTDAHAQARRYQPARPTVSPYTNLLRNNVGPLPNYYSLVRPQLNQLEFNRQQMVQQANQAASLRLLETQAKQSSSVSPTGKSSWFMQPGQSTFMNTSRYYSRTPTGRGR